MHCIGGQGLVSVLFVAVLKLFCFCSRIFHYLFNYNESAFEMVEVTFFKEKAVLNREVKKGINETSCRCPTQCASASLLHFNV